jgi:hypothetical protein
LRKHFISHKKKIPKSEFQLKPSYASVPGIGVEGHTKRAVSKRTVRRSEQFIPSSSHTDHVLNDYDVKPFQPVMNQYNEKPFQPLLNHYDEKIFQPDCSKISPAFGIQSLSPRFSERGVSPNYQTNLMVNEYTANYDQQSYITPSISPEYSTQSRLQAFEQVIDSEYRDQFSKRVFEETYQPIKGLSDSMNEYGYQPESFSHQRSQSMPDPNPFPRIPYFQTINALNDIQENSLPRVRTFSVQTKNIELLNPIENEESVRYSNRGLFCSKENSNYSPYEDSFSIQ